MSEHTAPSGSDGGRSRTPVSTYRLQVRPEFGFADAAAIVDYLDALGVGHAYLSPILEPTPGSTHGYDVVAHDRLNTEAGGRSAFDRLITTLHDAGMGAIADVVPNHVAVPTPAHLNAALWSVLRDGPGSSYARWFDVDWSSGESSSQQALLMPVLGARIGQVLDAGELSVDHDDDLGAVLRYYDHVFPIRPGTADLPLPQLVDRQWYRLAHWRVADEELNYRRFFDVDTLAGVRVEDGEVFEATHALLLQLIWSGALDGLRIDHPDGLADPREYLRRLEAGTDGAWVVVEKILEGEEELPTDWPCAGTTGYDALLRVGGLFVDPAGAAPLSALLTELTDDTPDMHAVVDEAKREMVVHGLYAEVHRLVDLLAGICADDVRLRDHTRRGFEDCVGELLVAFDRYRAYVVPGEDAPERAVEVVEAAAARARTHVAEDRHDTLDLVVDLALGRLPDSTDPRRAEFVTRFQQTCGPVMAKGIEDTAFYRWFRLSGLNEVGGDPARFGIAPEEFHGYAARQSADWPTTMTTLSTHDTKRSEDVRARLAVLAEMPEEWATAVREWHERAGTHRSPDGWPDPSTEYLIWQTLVGTWSARGPLAAERLLPYLEKATREAKRHTTWTSPEAGYDGAVADFATSVLADTSLMAEVGSFAATMDGPARVAILGQKLVQLVMPGVPDVYQGTELVDLSLVDPDNRRPVDYADRRSRLARLDGGGTPADLDDEKLLVTSRALRLRRELPHTFRGADAGYWPLPTSSGNAVAIGRGQSATGAAGSTEPTVVAVVTRLPLALHRHGGWGEHTLTLPAGGWTDALTGRRVDGGSARLEEILTDLPVALLHSR